MKRMPGSPRHPRKRTEQQKPPHGSRNGIEDNRYCYGANCTWHGPIRTVGTTPPINGHRLPCCPLCRGLLMEFPTAGEWWGPTEAYEAGTGKGGKPHPGYVAMMKWQVEQKVCFPLSKTRNGVRELRDAYEKASGVHVPLDSDPPAAPAPEAS